MGVGAMCTGSKGELAGIGGWECIAEGDSTFA
jgi:hypothetical protein